MAFNGAEPVRAETLERFAETFEPCGFRREAFYPCYGLAEATLLVSGGLKANPPVVRTLRRQKHRQRRRADRAGHAITTPAGWSARARRFSIRRSSS